MTQRTASILKILLACALIAVATAFAVTDVIAQERKAPDLAELKAQFAQAIRSSDQPRALKLAMEMIDVTETQHVEALYAAAQACARMDRREQAYLYLQRAIGAGFADRGWLRRIVGISCLIRGEASGSNRRRPPRVPFLGLR